MDLKNRAGSRSGVSLRAVIIGLILTPISSYWIFMTEIVRYQGIPTTISLFYSSIFILILLILANGLLRRRAPRYVLSQGELITIYVMLNISAALVSHDSLQILVAMMPYASHFATPENKWHTLFEGRLPDWLVVKDPESIKHFFQGGNLYDKANYGPWVIPVLCWSAFIIVLIGMFLCMNVLLRRQWTEREKLSYPLVQLPLDMTEDGAPLFRNKLLWCGFGLAAAIDIFNGLATLYPSIPMIPIKWGFVPFLNKPWSYARGLAIMFYPFGTALGMLLPVDMLFSCWFFFWFWKIERVVIAMLGYDANPNMPYDVEQSSGAYLAVAVFAIYMARHHIIDLAKHFIGAKPMDDKDEPIRYRSAIWFIILGSAFIAIFSRKAGMSTAVLVPFFIVFFAMSIAITRMRAELGPPAHDLHFAGPDQLIANIAGPRALGIDNLNGMSLFYWFNRAYRAHVMPFQLESFKMAERARMSYKRLFWVMMLSGVVGTFAGFWAILHLLYQHGAASSSIGPPNIVMANFGPEAWNRMNAWVTTPVPVDHGRIVALMTGFGITSALYALRTSIPWFPFHPVGFAVSNSWSMGMLWMPLTIAWITKLLILRYGGLRLYRHTLPFFLGIILGECVIGSLWTIWGISMHVPSYSFWP